MRPTDKSVSLASTIWYEQPVNLLWLFLITFLLRLPTLYTPIVDLDESVFAICGEVVRQGGKLYVDCVDHQPPLVYWFFAEVFRLFGANNMTAVHLVTTLIVFLTALLISFSVGPVPGPPPLTASSRKDGTAGDQRGSPVRGHPRDSIQMGFLAALFYVVFSTTHIPKIISTNIEILANLPLVAAWVLLFPPRVAPGKNRTCGRGAFLGGALMAVAFLLKYQVALILIFWILALLRRPKDFLLAGLGAATFLSLVGLTFYFQGNLVPFYTETLARGWEYARLGNTTSSFGKMVILRLGMTILCAAPLWYFFGKGIWQQRGRASLLGLWALGALLAALLGGRLYPHYFLLMLPPLCLMATPAVAEFWQRTSRPKKIVWGSLLAIWSLVFLMPRLNFQKSYQWFYQNYPQLDTGVEPMLHEKTYRAVGQFIQERSTPSDRIVVWGFSTPIYFFSGRLPGASSVWSDDLTGRVSGPPQSLDTSDFIRPGAWKKFMGEMAKNQPLWFVDTAPANFTYYGKYPIRHYPHLAAFLEEHYERVTTIDQVDLYRRR